MIRPHSLTSLQLCILAAYKLPRAKWSIRIRFGWQAERITAKVSVIMGNHTVPSARSPMINQWQCVAPGIWWTCLRANPARQEGKNSLLMSKWLASRRRTRRDSSHKGSDPRKTETKWCRKSQRQRKARVERPQSCKHHEGNTSKAILCQNERER